MNTIQEILTPKQIRTQKAQKLLERTGTSWFVVAFLGQGLFAFYILAFYGGSTLSGNFKKWDKALEHGLVAGDFWGNLFLALHLFLALVITVGGPLQLIPRLQKRFMTFHRWNGRIYILTAFVISLAGLYLLYTRGIVGGKMVAVGNLINATLIMSCAGMTWRTAVQRKVKTHRDWAIRTFLAVSGVWFFRLGFAFWILVNAGTLPGHTPDFDGWFDISLSLGHALLPIAVFELYRYIHSQANLLSKVAMSVLMSALVLLTGAAIAITTLVFWWPKL